MHRDSVMTDRQASWHAGIRTQQHMTWQSLLAQLCPTLSMQPLCYQLYSYNRHQILGMSGRTNNCLHSPPYLIALLITLASKKCATKRYCIMVCDAVVVWYIFTDVSCENLLAFRKVSKFIPDCKVSHTKHSNVTRTTMRTSTSHTLLCIPGKSPGNQQNRRFCGPQSWSCNFWEEILSNIVIVSVNRLYRLDN
jgi:hypothetical protein